MGCDGKDQVNLTNHPGEDKQPSWANSGRLAFSSDRNSDGGYDIYLLTLDPWQITRLTTHASNDESPALSPDGSKAAFVSYRDSDGDAEIYVLTVSDRSLVQITNNTDADVDPVWSPDGTKLAFASDRDGKFDIYTVKPDGTNLEKIAAISDSSANDRWPDLADYDGEEFVAFASDRDGGWEINSYDAYDLLKATDNADNLIDSKPSWNSSGEQIVFHTNRDSQFDIYKAYYDGSAGFNLTAGEPDANDSSPDWEPYAHADFCAGDE